MPKKMKAERRILRDQVIVLLDREDVPVSNIADQLECSDSIVKQVLKKSKD